MTKLWKGLIVLLVLAAIVVGLAACASGAVITSSNPPTTNTSPPTPPSTPTLSSTPTSTGPYDQYQLEYLLLTKYPDYFWCDPDFYPIAREGQEQANAIAQFPDIQGKELEFSAILEHLRLPVKTVYTDADKLSIYREHKVLTRAIAMTPTQENGFTFSLRTGQNQGLHIEGSITAAGQITIITQETSFNTCPICLTRGTVIDSPAGQIPVEQLQPGMTVWTRDPTGRRVAVPIARTSSTRVPSSFRVLQIMLADGRIVTAAPGHPTAELRPLRDYQVGDILDNGRIISIQPVEYFGGATFDLLPSGETGLYWANGIVLGSTLTQ